MEKRQLHKNTRPLVAHHRRVLRQLKRGLAKFKNGKNWIQGTYSTGEGYCAIGAVQLFKDDVTESGAIRALRASLPKSRNGIHYPGVISYNDDGFTTFTHIKRLYARAIKRTEKEIDRLISQ